MAKAGVALVPEGRRIFADFTRRGEPAARALGRRVAATGAAPWSASTSCSRSCASSAGGTPGALSGGQQQQLAIARALVSAPRVLLLDEPSLGLAPKLVDSVFAALGRIREDGVSILLVEQRAQRTVAFADRTHVLANGELRMTLTPDQADDTDTMVAAYLA